MFIFICVFNVCQGNKTLKPHFNELKEVMFRIEQNIIYVYFHMCY